MLGFGLGLNKWRRVGGGYVGLLDLYPNAAAAYSLRKLRAAYSGSAVRVRRSSDNTEQDIGFTTQGELDTASLLSFVNEDVIVYTSDFSSTEDLSETNGTGAAAQSIGGVDDAYKFTLSGGSGLHQALRSVGLSGGGTATLSFDYYIPSSNTAVDSIIVGMISGTTETQATTDAWASVILSVTNFGNGNVFFRAADGGNVTIDADGDVFYLKNIVITQTTADGLVSTWYDQSLSNDATQSTAADQPKIVSGGSLVTEGSKPAVDFDGVGDYFQGVVKSTISNTSLFSVFSSDSNTQDSVMIQLTVDASNLVSVGFGNLGTNNAIGARLRVGGVNVNAVGDSTFTATDQTLLSYIADNAVGQIYLDSLAETDSVSSRSGGIITTIGCRGDINNFYNGQIQELVYFNSDQSSNRTAIETNINTFYSIYP